ncbi:MULTISPECIES: ATP-binding cassette domain-containing protein [Flavobacterium]|uniref:ATP-binding cassette domain-containing protein n=1 Tax=Flavobacterium jumunjinense TaxID=998845 RepID=A0ABV5GJN8_9FLAO|nr:MULTISPECIES: ATP-binding cassette domain-containing protein [Flavobacterium]
MKTLILKSYLLIPHSKRKKLPVFIVYFLINTFLDFISLTLLVPLFLIVLDKDRLSSVLFSTFNINLNNKITVLLIIALIAFYIIKNILQSVILRFQSLFIYSISSLISEKLMNEYIHNSYINYTKKDKNAFFRDVFQLPIVFSTNILFSFYTLLSELIILLFIISIGILYNPTITLFSLLSLILFVLLLLKIKQKKIVFFNETIVRLYEDNLKNINNIFYGLIEIKTTKSEQEFQKKFQNSNESHNRQLALLSAFKQSNSRYFEILIIIGLSSMILFYMINQADKNTLILISFFAGASIKILPSFNKILNSFIDIKTNLNCVEILSSYNKSNIRTTSKLTFNNRIELKNISIEFNKKNILENISFQIDLGDFICISGKSGQGKSTLLHIISGLLSPKNGDIYIDNISANSNNTIFDFIGYVSQQPFLFQGTIRENITLFTNESNIDYEFLNKILIALDLYDWINTLPEKINSYLLLDSKTISGGQKQRIAIARALFFKPKVLLLDEATNQLNQSLEKDILKYIQTLTFEKKLSVIVVSHNDEASNFSNKKYILENRILKKL